MGIPILLPEARLGFGTEPETRLTSGETEIPEDMGCVLGVELILGGPGEAFLPGEFPVFGEELNLPTEA